MATRPEGSVSGRSLAPTPTDTQTVPTGPSDPRQPPVLRTFLTGFAALLAIFLGAACGGGSDGADAGERPSTWRGARLEEPVRMPEATLKDTRGRAFSLREETEGRVALLFFGYTHCPDVCPVQMANLGAVLEGLAPSVRRQIRVIFVTVDPRRDSAARLRSWLDRFGDGFVGLRGDSARVAELQRRLRVSPAVRNRPTSNGRYTLGHAAQVLAFGPDGRARLAYPSGTRQRDWAHDLPRLVRHPRSEGTSADSTGS